MIEFSNGSKLYRFITDGKTAKLQVDTSTYFPRDTEITLSESQKEALKDFIEEKLLPSVFLNKVFEGFLLGFRKSNFCIPREVRRGIYL